MRTANRNHAEKTALLECPNEEISERGEATLLQVCEYGYRAKGLIATATSGPAVLKGGDRIKTEEKIMMEVLPRRL